MAREGKWIEADEGARVVGAVLAHLQENPKRFGLFSDDYSEVISELEECAESVEKAKESGARFNFGIVM